jgi:glycosyltransferase involved in cell wall biosynthesis
MKFTVAVPSLNYARYIADCLSSVLAQDHNDFEVLVCDGGSTDGSLGIIEQFAAKDSRINLLSTADSGQADALNKAFDAATGEILCYLNADDVYLANDALSMAAAAFSSNAAISVVSFRSLYIDSAGKRLGRVNRRVHPLDRLSWIKYRGQIVQPSAFWRREVSRQCPFNANWHFCFDWSFFYEAYGMFGFMERREIVAGYRLHGANKSAGVSWKRIAEMAAFEDARFGSGSLRGRYMRRVSNWAQSTDRLHWGGATARRCLRFAINAASFATCYRLPGI